MRARVNKCATAPIDRRQRSVQHSQVHRRARRSISEEGRMNLTMARRFVSALALVAASFALCAVISTPVEVEAAVYSCHQGSACPHQASCDGAYFDRQGCSVTCFIQQGEPGELQAAGSASCGSSGGGGGDGDWWCGSQWCW
jgi:hypothetical protein